MQALIALALVSGQIGAILGALGPILAALKDSTGAGYGDALASGTIGLLVAVYFAGSALGSVAHLLLVFRLQSRNALLLRDHLIAESHRQRTGSSTAAPTSPGVIAIDVAAASTSSPSAAAAMSVQQQSGAPAGRRAAPELEAQFVKTLESEVTFSSALIRWTLLLSLGPILGLYQLPRELHGGASASFGVYLALLCVLGAFNGAQLSCVSTVVASWDVAGAERSIGLINLAFAGFAVAANWIHNGLSRIAADGVEDGLPGALYWAYVAGLVAAVALLCALTEFRRSSSTAKTVDAQSSPASSTPPALLGGKDATAAAVATPVATSASVMPSPHHHQTADGAALVAAMTRVEQKLTERPTAVKRELSPTSASPTLPPPLPLRLVVVGSALGFRRVGHGPYTRHHLQSLTLKHFGVIVRLHSVVRRPSLPAPAAAPTAAAAGALAAVGVGRQQQQQQQRFWVTLCRSPAYWMLLLAMAFSNGAFNVAGSWINSLCDAQGLDSDQTTLVSSLFWACTLVGRLVLALKATMSDPPAAPATVAGNASAPSPAAAATAPHALARNTLLALLVFTTGAVLTLVGLSVGSGSFSGAVTFAVLTGLCVSVQFPLLSALEMQCQLFDDPSTHSNAIASAGLVIVSQIGALALPLVMGLASDAIDSLPTSYAIAAAAMGIALLALVVFAFTARISTANSGSASAAANSVGDAPPAAAAADRSLGAAILGEWCTEMCCCGGASAASSASTPATGY